MIEIKNISKTFSEKNIFKNLSMQISNGESIAIIGQSGVGKSVLLNLLKQKLININLINDLNPDIDNICYLIKHLRIIWIYIDIIMILSMGF